LSEILTAVNIQVAFSETQSCTICYSDTYEYFSEETATSFQSTKTTSVELLSLSTLQIEAQNFPRRRCIYIKLDVETFQNILFLWLPIHRERERDKKENYILVIKILTPL
jgi:hypothetical protein